MNLSRCSLLFQNWISLEIDGNIIKTSDERNLNAPSQEIAISDYMNHRIENNYFELNDIEEIEFVEKYMNHESGSDNADSKAEYSEDQLQMVYRRIFNSLPKDYDEKYNQRLYERFLECFHHLPAIEAKLLITPIENIPDNDFWKQFSLERNIKTNALKQLTS